MIGYFVAPLVGSGTADEPYRGKWTQPEDFASPPVSWRGTTISIFPDIAVIRVEVDGSQLDEVRSDPEVLTVGTPEQLGDTITAQQESAADSWLEARGVPGVVVRAGDTRRRALRRLAGLGRLSVELHNRFGAGWRQRLAQSSLTLESQWRDLPQGVKDEFLAIAESEGWTAQSLGLTASSPLRVVLGAFAQEWTRWGAPFDQ